MTRLGSRQIDVLRGAADGKARAWHAGQGRFWVEGREGVHGEAVLERLLELGLVRHGAHDRPTSYRVELTKAGKAALREVRA